MDVGLDRIHEQALGSILVRTAIRDPERPAIIWRGRTTNYGDFNRTVNRIAHALSDRGIARGDRIALLAHNSQEYLELFFALAKLGAISVPINFMLNAGEVAFILGHSSARGIVTETALVPVAATAAELAMPSGAIQAVIADDGGAPPSGWESTARWRDHPDASEPDTVVGDNDPIQLMYTSGTESRPKGVTLTSRSLLWQYAAMIIDAGMTRDDIEIHALPFYHCAQLHCFLSPDVYLGATSVVLPGPDAAAILAAVEEYRATKLFCPPTVWIALLRHADFDRRDLSSLTKGYYGAAAMPVEVLRELSARLPGLSLWNLYGQTEMSPLATVLRPHEQLSHPGSAGRAALNVVTRVVDDEDVPLPPGSVGEIVHRSPHAMLGYWEDPDKTAEAFRGGWFHSGDLGVIDEDGYLAVVDRKKDMIKTGGENVASREVEEVLYGHPDVAEAAVFGLPHQYWIEAVSAAVVLRAGSHVGTEELIDFAKQHLASYKVPKSIFLTDSLPRNPSGKILKRELRTAYAPST
jgi:fatty-acyl-CoA synthase